MTKRPVNQRLINLWSTMVLEEERFIERSVPSAYNQIRAEFGYAGTRQEVIDKVALDIRQDTEEIRCAHTMSV